MYTANEAHVVMKKCCSVYDLFNRNTTSTAMIRFQDGQTAMMPLSLSIIPGEASSPVQQGKAIRQPEVFGKGINVIHRPRLKSCAACLHIGLRSA